MNLATLLPKVTLMASRAALIIQKNSPAILTYGGLAGMTAGTGLAIKKTLTAEEHVFAPEFERLLDVEMKRQWSDEGALKSVETGKPSTYSEEDARKDRFLVYKDLVVNTVRHYAVPAALFVGGAACVIAGHTVAARRLAATAAAYSSLEIAYNNLKEKTLDQRNEKDEIEGKVTDYTIETDEDGNVLPEESTSVHPYTYLFDAHNPEFNRRSNDANWVKLNGVQNWANNHLQTNGHIFLNDVLRALGMEDTKEGAVTGWMLDRGGDNFITFGLEGWYDLKMDSTIPGIYDYILNFNVDGLIFDKLGK